MSKGEQSDVSLEQVQPVGGFLGWIERVGNKIPDITMLFIAAFFITCVVSAILSNVEFGYVHPTTGKAIAITNMRGGTDGSFISTKGILTPNYFTGGHNFHSRFEFLPVQSLEKSYEMTMKLVQLIYEGK